MKSFQVDKTVPWNKKKGKTFTASEKKKRKKKFEKKKKTFSHFIEDKIC